jgi:hypothetical protein
MINSGTGNQQAYNSNQQLKSVSKVGASELTPQPLQYVTSQQTIGS